MKTSKPNSTETARQEVSPGALYIPWYIDKETLAIKNAGIFSLGEKAHFAFLPTLSLVVKLKQGEHLQGEESFVLATRDDFGYWHGKEVVLVPETKGNTASIYVYRSTGRVMAQGKASLEGGTVRFTVELVSRKTRQKKLSLIGMIGKDLEWKVELKGR